MSKESNQAKGWNPKVLTRYWYMPSNVLNRPGLGEGWPGGLNSPWRLNSLNNGLNSLGLGLNSLNSLGRGLNCLNSLGEACIL